MLLSQLHLSTSCLWSQPPQSHHEAGRGGIAAGLGHQEVQWPVTLVMGPVESWQFPRDLWSLANGHSLFILQEKRWIKFFCTGQWKRERATCVDGLPWVWGKNKILLGFTPWFAAHFLALIEKANRLSKSCSQERASLGSFVWNNSDVQWLLGQSTAGLGALLFITGAAPLQKITFTHNSHQ